MKKLNKLERVVAKILSGPNEIFIFDTSTKVRRRLFSIWSLNKQDHAVEVDARTVVSAFQSYGRDEAYKSFEIVSVCLVAAGRSKKVIGFTREEKQSKNVPDFVNNHVVLEEISIT